MITPADAMQIMLTIQACHPSTAPRMDDLDVARVAAHTLAKLVADHDFTVDELIAAVERRAKICREAPEAADIIRVARNSRNETMARAGVHTWGSADPEEHHGDWKAAKDTAPYPSEWTSEQRLAAYWHAIRLHAMPQTTAGWEALAEQAAESHRAHAALAKGNQP